MIKYIVGIDFGHGETAAWAVPLSEDNKAKLPLSGASLRLRASNDAQDRQLPSVIYRTPEGDYSLEFKTRYGIITQMKKRVAEMDAMDRQNYANYIHKIIERLKELNSDILAFEVGKPIFRLCMASPTKWSDEEKKEYLSFFNSAIEDMGLRFDWIIDESDAAFFSHCKEESDMQKCSLVIDYGSSTIDYTAIKNGRIISDKNWSNQQLGASLIENSMMMTVVPKKNEEYKDYAEMIIETKQMLESHNLEHIDPEQVLGFELRKLKEEKFKQQTDGYKLIFDFESITDDSDFESLIYVAKGKLSEVTQEYQEAVRADLINLRNQLSLKLNSLNNTSFYEPQIIIKDYRPDRIILSGGACIMRWFTWMVRDVFGIQEIVDDYEPSFVVAKGIALYAKAQIEALNILLEKINAIDFGKLYIEACNVAFAEATNQLISNTLNEIEKSQINSSAAILNKFCDFFRTLNETNPQFSNALSDTFNSLVDASIRAHIINTIYNIFHISITDDIIKLKNIDIIIPQLTEKNFEPGGSVYEGIDCGMANTRKLPRLFKVNDDFREKADILKLSNGVVSFFKNYKWNIFFPDGIEDIVENIRSQTIRLSTELFYAHQLFRTTIATN